MLKKQYYKIEMNLIYFIRLIANCSTFLCSSWLGRWPHQRQSSRSLKPRAGPSSRSPSLSRRLSGRPSPGRHTAAWRAGTATGQSRAEAQGEAHLHLQPVARRPARAVPSSQQRRRLMTVQRCRRRCACVAAANLVANNRL